jgi:ribosome-associated protein
MSVPVDITPEITFKTARSGGKGGQNVNKVETMVEGYFEVNASGILTPEQKHRVFTKLQNRINSEGILQVRSQQHRSQLSNKLEVIRKVNELINHALVKEKKRIPTKPSAASKRQRVENKKKAAEHKANRKKIRYNEF